MEHRADKESQGDALKRVTAQPVLADLAQRSPRIRARPGELEDVQTLQLPESERPAIAPSPPSDRLPVSIGCRDARELVVVLEPHHVHAEAALAEALGRIAADLDKGGARFVSKECVEHVVARVLRADGIAKRHDAVVRALPSDVSDLLVESVLEPLLKRRIGEQVAPMLTNEVESAQSL